MKAIRVHAFGGPEVLRLEDVPTPEPPAGHLRIRVAAAGLNFIEIYQRTGLYPIPFPWTPGGEGAVFKHGHRVRLVSLIRQVGYVARITNTSTELFQYEPYRPRFSCGMMRRFLEFYRALVYRASDIRNVFSTTSTTRRNPPWQSNLPLRTTSQKWD